MVTVVESVLDEHARGDEDENGEGGDDDEDEDEGCVETRQEDGRRSYFRGGDERRY